MDEAARDVRIVNTEVRDVEIVERQHGELTITTYITPRGEVRTVHRLSATLVAGGIPAPMLVEHMIKGPEDYAAAEYIIEHTVLTPTYDEFLAYERQIGDAGVPIAWVDPDPMYRILRDYIGYNDFYYHLNDYPGQVHHLLAVLTEHCHRLQEIMLDSPARMIIQGQHFDSLMTPPPFFRRYLLPYYYDLTQRMHERGKLLVCHADADTSLLLGLIKEAGFDMAECLVTEPMVALTVRQARQVWGNDVIIWGGIPSTLLCDPVTDQEFEDYMRDLFCAIAPGDAFILGVADNIMPESKLERLRRVGAIVRERGRYPIKA